MNNYKPDILVAQYKLSTLGVGHDSKIITVDASGHIAIPKGLISTVDQELVHLIHVHESVS